MLGHWTSGWASHVYLARRTDPEDARLYALKVPRTEHAVYAASQSLSMQGALPLQTNHPNVIATRELIDRHGRLYMVTDFVHGELLKKILKTNNGPLMPPLAASIVRDLARAVDFIHSRRTAGITSHRELFPGNVMLSYDGSVKLLDSGMASVLPRPQVEQYMAPEEAAELPDIDLRVDIHSLGLMLWELLTGRIAQEGSNLIEIKAASLGGRIAPPSRAGSTCGADLDAVVMKAMAVDREERHASAAELASILDGYLALVAPGYDPSREIRSMLSALFPTRFQKLSRLLDRWENGDEEPTAAGLDRPSSPLRAIEDAFRSRHTSLTSARTFSELDATLSTLSQDSSNTLPPLSPSSAEPSVDLDLELPPPRSDSASLSLSGDIQQTISHTDVSASGNLNAVMQTRDLRKSSLRLAFGLGLAALLTAIGTLWLIVSQREGYPSARKTITSPQEREHPEKRPEDQREDFKNNPY